MTNKKEFNYMENVLQKVNKDFISLNEEAVKKNNQILDEILNAIIAKMKDKDVLFKTMFQRVFYGGSYYDGLRVKAPEEFDLDLLLKLPKYAQPELTDSGVPGFVKLQFKNYLGFIKQPEAMPNYRCLLNLLDDDFSLDTQKVLSWMEKVVKLALNEFPTEDKYTVFTNKYGNFKILVHKGGPAMTLKVQGPSMKMDVDLVACFVCRGEQWPSQRSFRSNPVKTKPEFFIVPKKPKESKLDKSTLFWRLSFQEQERVLMDNKRTLKPTIKLLKKLRDTLDHKCIASYYIKTAVLHTAETKDDEFWRNSLSYVFMNVFNSYIEFLEKGTIPYYWNKNNNLIDGDGAKKQTIVNIKNRLRSIYNDVNKKKDDPYVLAKYLLTDSEFLQLKTSQMTLG